MRRLCIAANLIAGIGFEGLAWCMWFRPGAVVDCLATFVVATEAVMCLWSALRIYGRK